MRNLEYYSYYRFAKRYILSWPKWSHMWNLVKCVSAGFSGKYGTQITSFTPISTVIFVNRKCNLSCPVCYILDELNLKNAKEFDISLNELRVLLDHPLIKNSIRIGFTGGEPFLNKNIFELIDEVKKRKHILSIVTNGLILGRNDFVNRVVNSNIDLISISLYEENQEKLDKIITDLIDGGVFIKLHKVLEAGKLRQIIYDTIEKALQWRTNNILFLNYYPVKDDYQNVIFDNNEEFDEIKKEVKAKYNNRLNIKWPVPLSTNKSLRLCKMPFQTLTVDSIGNIAPCCFTIPDEYRYGNILNNEGNLSKAFNSAFYQELRLSLLDTKRPLHQICNNCYLLHENFYGL